MGFIIADAVSIANKGLVLSNMYATLHSTYTLQKKTSYEIDQKTVSSITYTVTGRLFYYTSQTASVPVLSEQISIPVTLADIAGNLVSMLYTSAKSKYTSTTDV